MNAGASGGETWRQVLAAEVILRGGETAWLAPEHFDIAYRSVMVPPRFLGFLGARFRVSNDDGNQAQATREALARRKATQPVGRPSAGSTFRNPAGDFAARLIEAAGLKGQRIGGAHVSTLHSNFILTEPGATAADVESLIALIRRTVRAASGIELQPEVRIVGEVPPAGAQHA
jgi:UDP-N-acetylmuramate dehydrogenase